MPTRREISLAACAMLAIAPFALAQQERVELVLPKKTLALYESIELQLVCHNMERPAAPAATVPPGLDLKLLNPNPSSNISIYNGVRTSRYTYSLLLTAKAVGLHDLGSITVESGGKTYRTEAMTIEVKESVPGGPRGDQYIFTELSVEPQSVYVTQSVDAVLTIGIREVVINGRQYELDLLRNVLDVRRSQLSVFANGSAQESTIIIPDSSNARHRYKLFTVRKSVRAEEIGKLTIGPIFLKAAYPTAVRRGFFGYDVSRSRSEQAQAAAVEVEVLGPPADGRPASFAGALGHYKLYAAAEPARAEQGKPVTLTITIVGSPLDGLAGPDLAANAELASRFDYTKDELIGDVNGNRKVFRRAIFPRQVGEQVIPPIEWSYFDPRTEQYEILATAPIKLDVDPATGDAGEIVLSPGSANGANGTALTVLSGGISPNYVETETLLAQQHLVLTSAHAYLLAAPPALWLLLTILVSRHDKLRSNRGLARRKSAVRRAEAGLKSAMLARSPSEQLAMISSALKAYLGDRFNLPPGEITPPEAGQILAAGGASSIAGEVSAFLESVNAVHYAPAEMQDASAREACEQVRRWMRIMEKARP